MRVRIDDSRDHELAGGVDRPSAGWCGQVGADLGDLAAAQHNVGILERLLAATATSAMPSRRV
jgi:hypothetical protein